MSAERMKIRLRLQQEKRVGILYMHGLQSGWLNK